MDEHYLHLLWRTKRLPMHLLKTTNNEPVRILHVGMYNTGSGPDFFNGRIELNQLQLSGNVEMHVKSSDWYAHGHHEDPAYDNVILHVVYEHDKLVFIEGIPIPTIELKELIDWKHYEQTKQFQVRSTVIPCAGQLSDCPAPVLWHQVSNALWQRLERKKAEIMELAQPLRNAPEMVLFHLMAKAFGMKTNALPFQELAHRIPFRKVIRSERKAVESIVFGASGLLQNVQPDSLYVDELVGEWHYQSHKLQIHPAYASTWHFKGCRPSGFPTIRLAQFAAFIHRMNWTESFWELPTTEIRQRMLEALTVRPSDYWIHHYHFGKPLAIPKPSVMSVSVANVVITNSVVPFLWWLADRLKTSIYREKAIELLELMPPERNQITDDWEKWGIKPKSAAESQGLIELKNELCNRKQCLNCQVGIQLLKT